MSATELAEAEAVLEGISGGIGFVFNANNTISLIRTLNGERTLLATSSLPVKTDAWIYQEINDKFARATCDGFVILEHRFFQPNHNMHPAQWRFIENTHRIWLGFR